MNRSEQTFESKIRWAFFRDTSVSVFLGFQLIKLGSDHTTHLKRLTRILKVFMKQVDLRYYDSLKTHHITMRFSDDMCIVSSRSFYDTLTILHLVSFIRNE